MSSVLCSRKLLCVADDDDNDMTQVYVALIEEDEQTELPTKTIRKWDEKRKCNKNHDSSQKLFDQQQHEK